MKKLAILILILLAAVFASGCITPPASDPLTGTWISSSDERNVLVFNADGTGTETYVSQNIPDVYNITWGYDGHSYLVDYPDKGILSADGKTLTLDYGAVLSGNGNGIVGTWVAKETEVISPGLTSMEHYLVFENHTGIYYDVCLEDPDYSMVNAFSWKQQNDGSYLFYDYTPGYLFMLSENETVQTHFGAGVLYTGNGLIGVWNRTQTEVEPDGSIIHAQRVFNADGTAKLTWYYDNGTVAFAYDQIWAKLHDYYAVMIPGVPCGELVLNNDGSLMFYYMEDPGEVYHKQ